MKRIVKSAERRCNSAKVRRKKIHLRQMLETSRNAGSLKRRVQSQVVRAEIKNRTPLRRKTHFEVKMHKTRQRRSTFGNSNVEKLHAAVASSTFPSENAKKLTVSDTF